MYFHYIFISYNLNNTYKHTRIRHVHIYCLSSEQWHSMVYSKITRKNDYMYWFGHDSVLDYRIFEESLTPMCFFISSITIFRLEKVPFHIPYILYCVSIYLDEKFYRVCILERLIEVSISAIKKPLINIQFSRFNESVCVVIFF